MVALIVVFCFFDVVCVCLFFVVLMCVCFVCYFAGDVFVVVVVV